MKSVIFIFLSIFLLSCSQKSNDKKNSSLETRVVEPQIENKNAYKSDSTLVENTQIKNSSYALSFWLNDTIYLYGKFPLNKAITLINNQKGLLFESRTNSYKVFEDPYAGKVVFTSIVSQPEKENLKNFEYCSFFEKPSDYELLEQGKNDSISVKKIDTLIRKTNLLELLLEKSGQKQSVEYSIKNSLPTIRSYTIDISSITIVSYKYFEKTNGPRIVFYKNKLFPLTGQCSFEDIYIYRYNSRYYIQSGSWCCGCGYNVFEIFRIDNQSIDLEYKDDSYAN